MPLEVKHDFNELAARYLFYGASQRTDGMRRAERSSPELPGKTAQLQYYLSLRVKETKAEFSPRVVLFYTCVCTGE